MISKLRHHTAKKTEDGFTLIEVMVVVLIMGILAAIAIPVYSGHQRAAFIAGIKSDVRNSVSDVTEHLTKKPFATNFIGARTTVTRDNTIAISGKWSGFTIQGSAEEVPGFKWCYNSQTGKSSEKDCETFDNETGTIIGGNPSAGSPGGCIKEGVGDTDPSNAGGVACQPITQEEAAVESVLASASNKGSVDGGMNAIRSYYPTSPTSGMFAGVDVTFTAAQQAEYYADYNASYDNALYGFINGLSNLPSSDPADNPALHRYNTWKDEHLIAYAERYAQENPSTGGDFSEFYGEGNRDAQYANMMNNDGVLDNSLLAPADFWNAQYYDPGYTGEKLSNYMAGWNDGFDANFQDYDRGNSTPPVEEPANPTPVADATSKAIKQAYDHGHGDTYFAEEFNNQAERYLAESMWAPTYVTVSEKAAFIKGWNDALNGVYNNG